MNGFENVTFTARAWLPGVDETTLKADGSVRVYGTWRGNSIDSGKSFSLDSYHYFSIKDGKISQSGDYFDATGMVLATNADPVEEVTEE
jgi:ketosteroid isomerase-like protein